MSSLMSDLLFSPAPKVGSPGSPLGGAETNGQGGDSFRQSFEKETRSNSRAEDRPSASEARRNNAPTKRDDVAEEAKPKETKDTAGVKEGQTTRKEATADSGEPLEDHPVEEPDAEHAAADSATVAVPVANPETTVALKPGTLAGGDATLAATNDNVASNKVQRATVGLNLNAAPKATEAAAADLLAEEGNILKPAGAVMSDGKPTELASVLATQSAPKQAETAVAMPRAFPLNMQASAGKGFKLEAWQFGRIEAGAKATAAELTEAGVKTPSPNSFHNTMAHVMNGSTGDVSSARMQVPVNISFGQPQWANMVAERSAWLFSQNINSAELILDPPELGRMTVQIQVHNHDQASVTFTSANPNVRDALDQSSQRLRELLSDQGMNLVNVDVSDRQPAEDQRESGGGQGGRMLSADESEAAGEEPAQSMQISLNSGVDYYV